MPKIFTRRELPLTLGLPLALQMAQQQLKAADKAADLKLNAEQMKSLKLMLPGDLTFPDKPTGNSQIVLAGKPSEEGSLYVIHMKWFPHSNSRPHAHKYDRYIWVLKGTWWLGAGPTYDNMEGTIPVQAGSFVTHSGGEIHYDGAKDEPCELLIVGMGPAGNIPIPGTQGGGRGGAAAKE